MIRRRLAALAVVAALGLPALASASQHLVRVVEVFPGTAAQPNAQYVVLQAYDFNQNFVGGYTLTVYDATDTPVTSFTFPANVPNAANQMKVLIATTEAQTLFGVTADMVMTASLPLAGGAVCFGLPPFPPFDCFSWGTFVDGAGGAIDTGVNFNAATGLVQGQAAVCDATAHGNADLNFDDCVDSAADHACGDAEPLANPVGSPPGFLAANPPCPVCGNDITEPAINEECDGTDDAACDGVCQVDCTCFNVQTILGKIVVVKDPQPGVDATKRKITFKAKEGASATTLTGNPIMGGASLSITLSGTTPSTQSFVLPPGQAFWATLGSSGFKYKDKDLVNGPIKLLIVKKTGSGTFLLTVLGKGSAGGLNLVPPNTGTEARLSFIPGSGGDQYCASFGGAAGGTIDPDTAKVFKAKNPTGAGVCPQ